jgi:ribosomal protein L37AE/L43A
MNIDAKTTMLLQDGAAIPGFAGQKVKFKNEKEAEAWLGEKIICPWCGKEITRKEADSISFKNVLKTHVINEYGGHTRTTTSVQEYNLKQVFRCNECSAKDERFYERIKWSNIIALLLVVLFFFGAYLYAHSWGDAAILTFVFGVIFYGATIVVLDKLKDRHEHRVTYDHVLECGAEDERDIVVL